MTDTTHTTLTDQALARLRKLADGNNIAHDKIALYGTEEQIYTLKGTLTLTPKCEVQTGRYPGPARGGKGRKVFQDLGTLHAEVDRHKDNFRSGRGWIEASLNELKAAASSGWGLQGAEITLPEQSVVMTASTHCPTCHGQKLITCTNCNGRGVITCHFCHGQRQERCSTCGGTGTNPQNPNQPCLVCNGRRFIPCRHCSATGQMACPVCRGRRGTPCPGCNGTGLVSEEIGIVCSAETHFVLDSQGLPSGLRNGLGRLGIENLGKGHADITVLPPNKDENEPGENLSDVGKANDDEKKKITSHSINYEAKMPYADLRVNLNGTKAIVSAFGKRGVLLGVPPFLDDALKPARETLKRAAEGVAHLEDTLTVRAVNEALQLGLSGKSTIKNMRRFYPVGLSQEVMQEIFDNLRLALKRQTIKTRGIVAALCSLISAGFFAGIFLTNLHSSVTQKWAMPMQFLCDLVILALPMGLSWFSLNLATRFELQRRYHRHTVALQQTTGKTGSSMLAAIVGFFVIILLTAPVKAGWLMLWISKFTNP